MPTTWSRHSASGAHSNAGPNDGQGRHNGLVAQHPRGGAGGGPMASVAVWLARCFLIAGTIGLPLLLAVSISGDTEAWSWVHYLLPPLFVMCAIVGSAYTFRRWADPPIWAWILSRGLAHRDEWRGR